MSAERPQSDQTLLRVFLDDAPAVAKLLVLGVNASRFIKAATVGPLWQAPEHESRAYSAQAGAEKKDGAAGEGGAGEVTSDDDGEDFEDGNYAAAANEEDDDTDAEEEGEVEEETEAENITDHEAISAVFRAYERLLSGEPASASAREARTAPVASRATRNSSSSISRRSNSSSSSSINSEDDDDDDDDEDDDDDDYYEGEDEGDDLVAQDDSDFESPTTYRRRIRSSAAHRAASDRADPQSPAAAAPGKREREDEGGDEHHRSHHHHHHNSITKSLAMYLPELKRKKSVVEELRERLNVVMAELSEYQRERARTLRKNVSPLLRTTSTGSRYDKHSCLAALYRSRLQCVSASHDIQGSVVDVCFEPSGSAPLLLACSVSGEIDESLQSVAAAATHTAVLYNYRIGAMWPLEGHGSSTVSEVAYAQNSTRVLTAGFDGNLCLWDVSRCGTTADAEVPLLAKINAHTQKTEKAVGQCIELFQMNERLDGLLVSVVGSSTHKRDGLVLTNYHTQQSQFLAKGYGSCNDATWSYLDDRVVVVFDSGTVGQFPILGGEPELWCGRTPVTDVACARTTQLTATGFRSGKLAWWDFRQGLADPVAVCTHMHSDFNQISFSSDDTFLQASMEDNHVYVFDTRVLDRPLYCLAHEHAPRVMHVPCDSIGVTMSRWTRQGFLFSCGAEGTVKVWDMRGATQNALLKTLRAHCFSVSCVDVSPDGTLAASGCDGNRVALHSISYNSSVFPPMTDQHDPLSAQFGPLKLP